MKINKKKMPIRKNEDIKFSIEQADLEDLEALSRAETADQRVERDISK